MFDKKSWSYLFYHNTGSSAEKGDGDLLISVVAWECVLVEGRCVRLVSSESLRLKIIRACCVYGPAKL